MSSTEKLATEVTQVIPPERPTVWDRFRSLSSGYALVGAWIVVFALFSILRPDVYPTVSNVTTMLGSQAVLLVLTLGLIVPLTVGDFDLSIAAVLTTSSMTTSILNVKMGLPIMVAVVIAIAIGALVGLVNGLLVVKLDLDSLVVTLGMSTLLTGVVQWISASETITGVSKGLLEWVTMNRFLGIAPSFWYGLVLTIIIWFVFTKTPLGQRLVFVGRSRDMSRLNGISVDRVRIGALVTSATVASLAGVLYTGTLGGADPSSGLSFMLPAFAAAFLGMTAIRPGRFNAIGTFVAVYFLVSGITGLQQLGLKSFVQQLFYGGALIIAVALARLARKSR
ncbi:ABC transporter permease [Leucobacter sp. USHLN153]|uniref:ABC transporter permease n=1 Tax=Leucobacter sp. USHLN153 TaxID=3081268 RepID=UPI0030182FF3